MLTVAPHCVNNSGQEICSSDLDGFTDHYIDDVFTNTTESVPTRSKTRTRRRRVILSDNNRRHEQSSLSPHYAPDLSANSWNKHLHR